MSERHDVPELHDVSELAAGYAFGILTPEETAEYEAFLAGSADARDVAAAFDSTSVILGLDAPPASPSPQLKSNIMAMIATTPQHEPLDANSVIDIAALPTAGSPVGATAGVSARKAKARWSTTPMRILASAAAAAVLFAAGTLVGLNVNGNNTSELQHASELQQANELAQINSAPDAQRESAAVAGGGTATLVWSDTIGKSAILINDLSKLPSDETYELWYIRDDMAHSAGTMDASAATTWRVLDGAKAAGDTVGVTVEPRGGSEQPTTTPVVAITS